MRSPNLPDSVSLRDRCLTLFTRYYWRSAFGMSALIFVSSSWPMPPQPPIAIPFYDKWAHFATYTLLGLSYLNAATQGGKRTSRIRIFYGYIATILYGLSDEFHQSFVPGRNSEWADVLADAMGASFALVIYFRWNRRKR